MKFRRWLNESSGTLQSHLESLRQQMVQVAQQVLNNWKEKPGRGACRQIATAISNLIEQQFSWAYADETAEKGHTWILVATRDEACEVDIPCWLYETSKKVGGGYAKWTVNNKAVLNPEDIRIWKIDYPDWTDDDIEQIFSGKPAF